MKYILAICAALTLSACTDNNTARRALSNLGFTQIQTTGYAFFGCGESAQFSTGFIAVSPTGQTVKGVVCSGWLRGATVRFY